MRMSTEEIETMTTTTYRPHTSILLPGPVVGAYQITLRAESCDWSGQEISHEETINGTAQADELEQYLNSNYSAWYPYLGCEISIDYGKGAMKRVLCEKFGQIYLERA